MAVIEFQLPELGEGVFEAELVEWLVQEGEQVESGQELAEVMTDKATMQLPAPFGGRIVELQRQAGDLINVGDVILSYDTEAEAPPEEAPEEAPKAVADAGPVRRQTPVAAEAGGGRPAEVGVPAAPSVRRMARELGVSLSEVCGSGPGGRILIGDLAAALKASAAGAAPRAAAATDASPAAAHPHAAAAVTPDQPLRPGSRIKLRGLRRKIASRLAHAKRKIPHYSYVDQCDVSQLVRLRQRLKDQWQQQGVKLTYLAFFVKAAAEALQEHPLINSQLDEEAGEIVLHEHCHIGIATNTPNGLMVPVIRHVERLDVRQIAREIERLSDAARAGQVTLEELQGGTFTVTSIGNVGGLITTPIINHPQTAIMGLGKIERRPVYNDAGQLVPADLLYLSFSFDHRVIDGAVGAEFGNTVIRRLHDIVAREDESADKPS